MNDAGVFYLRNVLQFVIDRFDQGSFSEQNLVGNTHQWILHIVFLTFSDKLYAIKEKGSQTEPNQYILCLRIVFLWCSPETYLASTVPGHPRFHGVNMKLRISPLSLTIRCSLNPKNHPIEYFPRPAIPSNVLWIRIFWLRQTHKGVNSTKLMSVQAPSRILDENNQRKLYFLL